MNRSILIAVAASLAALFSSCKTIQASVAINPSVSLTLLDADIVFSCNGNGKTGLYLMNIASGAVTEFVKPQLGSIHNPSISCDGKSIEYLFAENNNGKALFYFATTSLKSGGITKVFQFERPVSTITVSSCEDLIYFTSAQYFGHSSPINRPSAKMMELYTVSRAGKNVQRVSNFGAYVIGGDLHLEKNSNEIYLNLIFDKDNLPDGPYKYNLSSKTLTYLVPSNMNEIHPGVEKDFNRDFYITQLVPIPTNKSETVLLKGAYIIYALDVAKKFGRIIHEQQQNSRYKFSNTIRSLEAFHNSRDCLFFKEDSLFGSFVIVKDNGEEIKIPVDMAAFEKHFYD